TQVRPSWLQTAKPPTTPLRFTWHRSPTSFLTRSPQTHAHGRFHSGPGTDNRRPNETHAAPDETCLSAIATPLTQRFRARNKPPVACRSPETAHFRALEGKFFSGVTEKKIFRFLVSGWAADYR